MLRIIDEIHNCTNTSSTAWFNTGEAPWEAPTHQLHPLHTASLTQGVTTDTIPSFHGSNHVRH